MTLVSCIMPTANRRKFVPSAIDLFLSQDHPDKELIIVDDGSDRVEDIIPCHPQIRYITVADRLRLGSKRNLACSIAQGEVIVHWDDDDWHAPWRISYQLASMHRGGFDLCGADRVLFVDAANAKAWEYVHPRTAAMTWLCGTTLCYRKAFWAAHKFPDIHQGEDSRFVFSARGARVGTLCDNRFCVARIHAENSCPKRPRDARWELTGIGRIRAIVGHDWEPCFGGDKGIPLPPVTAKRGRALISSASGIGDIIRVTPLVRAAYRLGYDVDVLLRPDDASTPELLRGAREIKRLIVDIPSQKGAVSAADRLRETEYEVATFTGLSAPLSRWVRARNRYAFPGTWNIEGELAGVKRLALSLGWEGRLPQPFVMKSPRRFDIPDDTVALHPGCKPNWPWKKWHDFDSLARLFPSVAIVGMPADLNNAQTYFKRPFRWPPHAKSFVGMLNLPDTAALLSQCATLISLDSGMMHLGVAVGTRTFGIFGITSPERECFESPLMESITKGLDCEAACRRSSPSRRDCSRHLECLRTLSAEDVLAQIKRLQAIE